MENTIKVMHRKRPDNHFRFSIAFENIRAYAYLTLRNLDEDELILTEEILSFIRI